MLRGYSEVKLLSLDNVPCNDGRLFAAASSCGSVLIELVEVKTDEQLLELATMGEVADDLVHVA